MNEQDEWNNEENIVKYDDNTTPRGREESWETLQEPPGPRSAPCLISYREGLGTSL